MAIGTDKVQVLKQESGSLGGNPADDVPFPSPIAPQEDVLESAGLYLQDATNRDETVFLERDNGAIRAQDANSGGAPSEIVTGYSHAGLRQLVHLADGAGGPWESWASGSFRETLPSGSPFPTTIIWWTDPSKTAKIVQKTITFNGIHLPTVVSWAVFASDGTTVISTVTDTITYTGVVFELSRTRTVT